MVQIVTSLLYTVINNIWSYLSLAEALTMLMYSCITCVGGADRCLCMAVFVVNLQSGKGVFMIQV